MNKFMCYGNHLVLINANNAGSKPNLYSQHLDCNNLILPKNSQRNLKIEKLIQILVGEGMSVIEKISNMCFVNRTCVL